MGIIEAWHPDVEKFITNKTEPGILENFNVSVGIWEDFWHALVNTDEGRALAEEFENEYVNYINVYKDKLFPILEKKESIEARLRSALEIKDIAQRVNSVYMVIADAIINRDIDETRNNPVSKK